MNETILSTAGGTVKDEERVRRLVQKQAARDERLDNILEARPVEFLDLDSDPPPVDWLIPGWLATRDIALFAGAGGTGKSTTAANLAQSLARGKPWCGIEPTRACRVLYVDEEMGQSETHRLFHRLGGSHPSLQVAASQGVRLHGEDDLIRLEALVRFRAPDVVILDSVQQVFGDTDENSSVAVGAVYAELFGLRDKYGVTVVLVHHKRKAANFKVDALELVRGSTAHGTQSSTVWFAVSGGPNVMDLRQVKRRGGGKRSMRIRYAEDTPGGTITLTGETLEDAETALEKLSDLIVERITDDGEIRRKTVDDLAESQGFSRSQVHRALGFLERTAGLWKPARGLYRLRAFDPTQDLIKPGSNQDQPGNDDGGAQDS